MSTNPVDVLRERGFVQDITDEDGLRARFDEGPVTFYVGFDPTAVSLHAGNLVGIMAMAWLGHLRFKAELTLWMATGLAWLLVLPEYALNIKALRMGYGIYLAAQMAAFRLCAGVVWIALVSRYVLGEELTTQKLVGFISGTPALLYCKGVRVQPKPRHLDSASSSSAGGGSSASGGGGGGGGRGGSGGVQSPNGDDEAGGLEAEDSSLDGDKSASNP